jgi:hypothetical protein
MVLPVSRTPVAFRAPSGHDEALLAESVGDAVGVRVELVRRLAPPTRGSTAWDDLPYVDVDAALLGLRRFLAGDRLIAEVQCRGCAAWGDLAFSIEAYFEAHKPRSTRHAPDAPTVADVVAAVNEHGPGPAASAALEASYRQRHSGRGGRRDRARLEDVAPLLSGPVDGVCPSCGAAVSAWFDPGAFVIAELRPRAAALFDEVHRLASAYGWTEDSILSLPATRRTLYAGLIGRPGQS